jgi:hypothetical protein
VGQATLTVYGLSSCVGSNPYTDGCQYFLDSNLTFPVDGQLAQYAGKVYNFSNGYSSVFCIFGSGC